ncbi:hypothetical protein TcCL_NonESM06579, partial [Trypanosoma cruzi]
PLDTKCRPATICPPTYTHTHRQTHKEGSHPQSSAATAAARKAPAATQGCATAPVASMDPDSFVSFSCAATTSWKHSRAHTTRATAKRLRRVADMVSLRIIAMVAFC